MGRPANPMMRATLIAAARAEFAAHGLAAARVEEITRRAGTSKGAFYLHFQSKEELFQLITREFLDGLLEMFRLHEQHLCMDLTPDAMRHLLAADLACSEYLWENRETLRMVLEGAYGTSLAYLADEFVDAIQRYMTATVARHAGMAPHISEGMDPEVVSMFLTGAIRMVARRILRSEERPDFAHVSRQLRRILFGGLFRPEVAPGLMEALRAVEDAATAEEGA